MTPSDKRNTRARHEIPGHPDGSETDRPTFPPETADEPQRPRGTNRGGRGEADPEKFATACVTPLPGLDAPATPAPPGRETAPDPDGAKVPPRDPDSIRCFLALDISPEVRAKLADLLSRLRKGAVFTGSHPSWVPAENIHLTLHFLGGLAPETLKAMKPHLDRVAAQFAAPRLAVRMLGAFPNVKMPKVLWIGISKPDRSLFNLREALLPVIARAGVRPDRKPFTPHLTLARIRSVRGVHGLMDVVASHRRFEAGACRPGELILFQSELCRDGAVYTPLHRSPLAPPPESDS